MIVGTTTKRISQASSGVSTSQATRPGRLLKRAATWLDAAPSEAVISFRLQRSHQFVDLRRLFADIPERLHIGELISGWKAGGIVALRRREQLAGRDVWVQIGKRFGNLGANLRSEHVVDEQFSVLHVLCGFRNRQAVDEKMCAFRRHDPFKFLILIEQYGALTGPDDSQGDISI